MRLKKTPSVDGVRSLTQEEVRSMKPGKAPAVLKLRDSHHLVAKLFAIGLRPGEVAARTGYSLSRISVLRASPAIQELISQYQESGDTAFVEQMDCFYQSLLTVRNTAVRMIQDKLEATEPDDVTFRELIGIHDSMADRTGYGKRSTVTNINVDFAARLDRAVQRSHGALEGPVEQLLPLPAPAYTRRRKLA